MGTSDNRRLIAKGPLYLVRVYRKYLLPSLGKRKHYVLAIEASCCYYALLLSGCFYHVYYRLWRLIGKVSRLLADLYYDFPRVPYGYNLRLGGGCL